MDLCHLSNLSQTRTVPVKMWFQKSGGGKRTQLPVLKCVKGRELPDAPHCMRRKLPMVGEGCAQITQVGGVLKYLNNTPAPEERLQINAFERDLKNCGIL